MEIITGAMTTLLPKLTALLTGEYKLQRRLRDDIMFLKSELERMQPTLEKVSEAPVSDKLVRMWAMDLRELSYDIEDSVDKFMVRVNTDPSAKPRGLRGFIHRSMRLLKTARLRHDIATDVLGIKKLVNEVAARRDRYKIDSACFVRSAPSTIDPRVTGMFKKITNLVGINGPLEDLAKLLMEPEHQLKVISIVGVGGLGKTTLVNTMYQQLSGQFNCHAFTSVSLNPDIKGVLSSILRQVSFQRYCNIETWTVEEIIYRTREILEDKRYLVIIDDIWDQSAWEIIKCAFVENNCSSRIITTTRVLDVAAFCCSKVDGAIYKLKHLSHDDSKKLFYRSIFGSEDGCLSELKEVSEKILKKCGGVPLAINAIASLLASETNINKWYSVDKSICSVPDKSGGVENMRNILSISYYGLPSHLRACLLYLSIFPEDYSISKEQLIRRWIFEGFIPGEDVVTLYELGEKYFMELVNKNMIQPEYIDAHGRVLACRVHDMVLDLITSLSYEENFAITLPGQRSRNLPKKIHRLSLQNNADGHDMANSRNLSHLRSLVIFPRAAKLLPPLSCFHLLRVLDFEGCHDLQSYQIDGLLNLLHLRCLVLKDTEIASLPKEIGKLHYLQTIDLRNSRISELPSTFVQLRQLMQLYIDRSVMLPVGFGAMKALQALTYIGVSKSPYFIEELGNLTELRTLHISVSGIRHRSYKNSLVDSLCNLKKLHELCILGGVLSTLPTRINSCFLCLKTLDMKIYTLTHENFRNLGALRCLFCLHLTVLEIQPVRLVVGNGIDRGEFQCLVKFSFACDAMRLIFGQHAMPSLENLDLAFTVRETKDLNLGLENLHSLKHATIRIDCGGCSVNEVEHADSAIRKSGLMNPNYPRLDVIRHFECMIQDVEKLQVHDEINETTEESGIDKIGPWGGNGGGTCDIKAASLRLESVTICSGTIVDALAFSYCDVSGKRHTTNFWGGIGGSAHTICLGASEYIIEVSGTVGPFFLIQDAITSLKFVTNRRSYGPFGVPLGTPFCSQVKKNHSIVGFFGRSGAYLHAIGVYVRPL
ncbi:hypothetical protein ACP4OV_008915 [Aristida adscensionis]